MVSMYYTPFTSGAKFNSIFKNMCVGVCRYMNVYVCACVLVCTCEDMCLCGGQRSISGVPQEIPALLFETVSGWDLGLSNQARLAGQQTPVPTCSCLPSRGVICMFRSAWLCAVGSGDLASHACRAHTALTKLSSLSPRDEDLCHGQDS